MRDKRISELSEAEKESRRERFVEDGRGLVVIDPVSGLGRDLIPPNEKPETIQ